MTNISISILMAILGVMLAFNQILLKRFLRFYAAMQGSITEKLLISLKSYLPWAIFVVVIINVGLWIWILTKTKLSTVYPMISLSYVAMLFFAYFFEHEPIHWSNIGGVLLIVGGVMLLAFGR